MHLKSMNIFLTGEKNIGKSTIINEFLEGYSGFTSGFVTQKRKYTHLNDGIFIFDINDIEKKTSDSNLVGLCGKTKIIDSFQTPFDMIGVNSISRENCDLIIMDELGVIEEGAKKFRDKVISVLHKNIPVLGVIKDSPDEYSCTIRNRKDTLILNVTKENRKAILKKINDEFSHK